MHKKQNIDKTILGNLIEQKKILKTILQKKSDIIEIMEYIEKIEKDKKTKTNLAFFLSGLGTGMLITTITLLIL